jgi:hypothetical protein
MSRERDTFDMFQDKPRGRFGDGETSDRPIRCNADARSNLTDLTLVLMDERPLSIAVADPAKPGTTWAWLAKSQIEYRPLGKGAVEVTLPTWLAKEKGLI